MRTSLGAFPLATRIQMERMLDKQRKPLLHEAEGQLAPLYSSLLFALRPDLTAQSLRKLGPKSERDLIDQALVVAGRHELRRLHLGTYDIVVVSSSAGKDSQAMLDDMVRRARAQGLADRLVMIHADLRDSEWEGTTELVAEHAVAYGLPLYVTTRKKGTLLEQVVERGKWPGTTRRYCTSDHKRDPIRLVIGGLVAQLRDRAAGGPGKAAPLSLSLSAGRLEEIAAGAPVRVLNCIGLRAQESTKRRRDLPWVRDIRASSSRRIIDTYLPILDWPLEQVWERIRQSGVRHHPAYDRGMPRLSCVFCVFAPKEALLLAGHLNPQKLEKYVAVERLTKGHTFKLGLSLAQIQAQLQAGYVPQAALTAKGWQL